MPQKKSISMPPQTGSADGPMLVSTSEQGHDVPADFPELEEVCSLPGTWKISKNDIDTLRKYFNFWWILAAIGIPLLFAEGLGMLFVIPSMVFFFLMLYKFWALVPPAEAETTPGKAVGFMFIPIYNLHWILTSIYGLSKHYDALNPNYHVRKIGLGWTILMQCMVILDLIPYLNIIAAIAWLALLFAWGICMMKVVSSFENEA